MDKIQGMKTFVAVANQKSFTKGAKVIGISTKLASKYIGQLETQLGVQLFNRTTRSVTLTETGIAYFEQCQPILDQLDELEGVIQQRQSRLAGTIRITASTGFGSKELIAALHLFQKANPEVVLDLQLADKYLSIIEDGVDVAIRFGNLDDSSLVARKLTNMRGVVYASPEYLATHGEPSEPAALATHNCLIQKVSSNPNNWNFTADGEIVTVNVNGNFKANSPRAIAHMAAGGIGIGRGPKYVVEPFLEDGSLQLILEDFEPSSFPLCAVYPPSRHLTARIRALIDHLVDYFADEANN